MDALCAICLLRSTQSSGDVYLEALKNFESQDDGQTSSFICQCCLGLSQPLFAAQYLSDTRTKFDEELYDTNSFNLCISYPLSIFIRDRVLQFLAQRNGVPEVSFATLKDVLKFCYKHRLAKLSGLNCDINSDFNVCLTFKHELDAEDVPLAEELLDDKNTDANSKRRKLMDDLRPISRTLLSQKLFEANEETLNRCYKNLTYFAKKVENACEMELNFERLPLFIGGRYQKFSRYVHQTPWIVDGEKRSKDSVQEIISRYILDDIKCDEMKFTASGREDADVRMLGDGRPFALQLFNPRKKSGLDLDAYQLKINSSSEDVQVNRLRIVTQQDFDTLNKSEESKIKNYVALCYFCKESFDVKTSKVNIESLLQKINLPLEITQKTPIRVLHRRPLLDRKRKIYRLDIFPVDDVHFQLLVATEAGTYVKEFVHGDFGRTKPSLGDLLGASVDILDLDVEKIDFDWP